jgi:hypothetical protein
MLARMPEAPVRQGIYGGRGESSPSCGLSAWRLPQDEGETATLAVVLLQAASLGLFYSQCIALLPAGLVGDSGLEGSDDDEWMVDAKYAQGCHPMATEAEQGEERERRHVLMGARSWSQWAPLLEAAHASGQPDGRHPQPPCVMPRCLVHGAV